MKNKIFSRALMLAVCSLMIYTLLQFGYSALYTRLPADQAPTEFFSTDTNDDLQHTFSMAIKDAKETVLLIVYTLRDRKIIKALRDAADRGVDVQVITDHKASAGIDRILGKNIQTTMRLSKGLMHQKILVIDQKQVWIGSANMTPTSLKMHGNLVAGLVSPKLATLIREKADYMSQKGRVLPILPQEFHIGGQRVQMWFFPDNPDGVQKVKQLIREAKKTVKIAMFTWTRQDLAEAVNEAYLRGVEVSVIMDRSSSRQTSKKVADFFIKNHVPLRVNTGPGLLHHKCMIIDDTILVNGSANWTFSAFNRNDDCFQIFYHLTKRQEKFLHNMWNTLIQESEEKI